MTQTRPLYEIAADIRKHWPKPYLGAEPYIRAMATMDLVSSNYGAHSGKSIVLYFLANAHTWRGEDARRIKAELSALVGMGKHRRK